MRFSLIMATVGRTDEVKRFLEHLDRQTYRDFELIVVDQNPDDRLAPILEAYKNRFPISHLRSERGLSRARNVGLKHISGDIVAFPDDDCWYPPDLLERVVRFFEERPDLDGLTGRAVCEQGTNALLNFPTRQALINRFNILKRSVSFSIFLRAEVVNEIGKFDEFLGVGAGTPWGAGEEVDYLLRAIEAGFKVYYDPSITVFHPQRIATYDERVISRVRSYARGGGRVLRKHHYPLWFVLYLWLRSAGGICLSLLTLRIGKARYHFSNLLGSIEGWMAKISMGN